MKPYVPEKLPLADLDFRRLLPATGRANAALARYDGLLQGLINPALLLSPLTLEEAVLSSKIEGTQVTVDEILEHDASPLETGEKEGDIQEVSNYRKALYAAREYLRDYPIRLGFVRQLHSILMDSVRGEDKTPGEFRLDQNWIGRPGATLEGASFVPPSPLALPDYLRDWESYLGSDDIDPLIQTALVHAQFELLHPFKDGNGRIGRLLIPLFLYQKGALSQPMFYLSQYLETHRAEYYQRLRAISAEGDWDGWIAFFLRAVEQQSTHNSQRVRQIQALYEEMKSAIQEATHSQYSANLLDAIFVRPIFSSTDLARELARIGIHKQTTPGLLRQLREAGILEIQRPGRGSRPTILSFPRLLALTEGGPDSPAPASPPLPSRR